MNKVEFLDLEDVEWFNKYIEEHLTSESIDLHTFFGERYKLITKGGRKETPIYAFINKNGVIEVDIGMKKMLKAVEASKYKEKVKPIETKPRITLAEETELNELWEKFRKCGLNKIETDRILKLYEKKTPREVYYQLLKEERERLAK